jgi:hypothetical protein
MSGTIGRTPGSGSTRRIPELDYRTPLEAAATEPGARRVEEILGRLRYGIPGWRNPNIDAASRKVTIMGWGASNTVKSVKTIFLCRYL